MSKLDHALSLAAQGFKVFPLFPNRKTPAITKWQRSATSDETTIRSWWSGTFAVDNSRGKKWVVSPDSNIGIHTDGLVVIDVDVKNDVDGRIALKSLPPCKTRISKTPTGGFHIIFSSKDKNITNMTALRPGLDVRTKGGFITAPGSTIGNVAYEWVNPGSPIAPLTAELSQIITAGVTPSSKSITTEFGEAKHDYTKLPDSVPVGERDHVLFSYASSWRERNIAKEQAYVLMEALHGKVVQKEGEEFTLAEAIGKVDHVWESYKPGGAKDPAVTTKPTIEVKAKRKTATLQEAIDHFVFIEAGSKVADTRRHPTNAVMTLKDFKNSMRPDRADGGEIVDAWMRSPSRQTVRDISYFPQENLPVFDINGSMYFNTYYGPGLDIPDDPDPEIVNPMLDHINFMYPDERSYKLMLLLQAFTVQYPHERIPWCFLTVSMKEGIGKGLLYYLMSKVVGEHNSSIVQPDELSEKGGAYNGYISNKILVCWDEIKTKASDHERLRLLITSTQLMINHKYGAKQSENIFANTMAFSNHLNALHISPSDRRFYVECNYDEPRSRFYYDKLWASVDADLPAHWLSMLKKIDVSQFAWSSAPRDTQAKSMMKNSGEDAITALLNDCVEDSMGPFSADIICSNTVKQYLERVGPDYGINEVNTSVMRKIANFLSSLHPPLPTSKFTVPQVDSNAPNRVRCKVLRRYDFWKKQSDKAIVQEYLKGRLMIDRNVSREEAAERLRGKM